MQLLADNVSQLTTSTGTGPVTLGAINTGYRAFAGAFAEGARICYGIRSFTQWEVGVGTLVGSTLERTTVLASSNAGALVDFAAGAKTVYCTAPASSFDDAIRPELFGAVGNGIVDDTAMLQEALDSVPLYGKVQLATGATYLISDGLVSRYAGEIDLNGSTIVVQPGIANITALVCGQNLASYVPAEPLTLTKGQPYFAVPSNATVTKGDLVRLLSDTVVSPPDYQHGIWATVVDVSGGVAWIDTVPYETFAVDDLEVWRSYPKLEVTNGVFDLTGAPNVAGEVSALYAFGNNIHIHGITARGSVYAGRGIGVYGNGALVENCAIYGFLNRQGLIGGGKSGYGVQANANNSIVRRSQFYDCKHGVTSGARTYVAINVSYVDCTVHENDIFISNNYSGSYDFHSNVRGVCNIVNCSAYGMGPLLTLRAPCKVLGGEYVQSYAGSLVRTWDQPFRDIEFRNLRYSLASSSSAFMSITDSNTPAETTDMRNVVFEDCRQINTGGVFLEITKAGFTAENVTLDSVRHNGPLVETICDHYTNIEIRRCEVDTTDLGVWLRVTDGTGYFDKVRIIENAFSRSVNTSTRGIVYVAAATSETTVAVSDLTVSGNTFKHTGDTNTGYSISLNYLDIDGLRMSDNYSVRGEWRAFSLQTCNVKNGIVSGNVTDGDLLFFTLAATALDHVSVVGNVGNRYEVGALAVKTNYVDGVNNFPTYTP